jgi:lysyl endopeptidase
MKTDSMSCTPRVWARVVLVAAAVLSVTIPAVAERPIRHVGPETAVGGHTLAEQAAMQRELHDQLSAILPAGVGVTPVRVEISQEDRDELAAPPDIGHEPLRVGVVKPVPGSVGKPFGNGFNAGVVETGADGGFVWALTVISPEAQAIRLHLSDFSLPDHTEMYLLGDSGQAHGPYTGAGRNGDGDFWTRSIVGESGQLILRYTGTTPEADQRRMSFVIEDLGHIRGRRPPRPQTESHDSWPCSDNAECLVDVNCTNTGPAAPAEDAVAKMEWIRGPFIYSCTGGLLNDTDASSQIPYFLTANHCLDKSNSSLETFFHYTTDSCDGTCPDSQVTGGTPPDASTVGYTVVASGRKGDYTLGTLDEAPPGGAVFLGWNNTSVAFSNGVSLYRISNPNFGPQVYSQHDVDSDSPTCTGWPRGERIYSVDQTGATMGGSSGSPVVNSAGEVVGQLSGCCGYNCGDVCDSGSNSTVDGALAYYWDSVAPFLDPQGGGCSTDTECNDGLFCSGTESCVSGTCQSSGDPCGSGTTCNEASDTCDVPACSTNGDCDDGQWCNGMETCSGGTCQAGNDPCPGQSCDETNDQCVSCGGNKASCNTNADCCSGNCRGGTCRGN